jgi:hypothetical protein
MPKHFSFDAILSSAALAFIATPAVKTPARAAVSRVLFISVILFINLLLQGEKISPY